MSDTYRSLKKEELPSVRVVRHVMPTTFVEEDGEVCSDFEKLGDAVGFPADALDPAGAKIDSVVLALALLCNDLLDVLSVAEQMRRGKSVVTTPSPYESARTGRAVWATRVMSAIIHEALVTLDTHAELLRTDVEAVTALSALTLETAGAWRDLVALASAHESEPLRNFFLRVRNKLSYHYADPKLIAAGYKQTFVDGPKTPFNSLAYISSGEEFGGVRFHFADAAVQQAMETAVERAASDSSQELTRVASMAVNAMFNFVLKFMDGRVRKRITSKD
jgi:hypothetical protein